jgi:anti-sigma factor RsiW
MTDREDSGASGAHLSEEQLVWHGYGETTGAIEIELHLGSCPQCRAALEALKLTLRTIEAWPAPERAADYGDQVWRSLVRRDGRIDAGVPWWRRLLAPRPLAVVGALATVAVAAFLLGRQSHRAEPPEELVASPVVRQRILADALSEHLERSQRVLLEIANGVEGQGASLRDERARAGVLVDANRLYRLTAARDGQVALASVLDDLERVLLDVARGPEDWSPGELDRLRARVDEQGLVFKVGILEQRLRELGEQPMPRTAAQATKGRT